MRSKLKSDDEAEVTRQSDNGAWERAGILALLLALLAITIPSLFRSLWTALYTGLAVGEVRVSLPVRGSALADPEPVFNSTPPISALEGSLSSADFVVQFLDPQAHTHLTLARAIPAAVLLCGVVAISAVALRVARNRDVFRLLSMSSAYGGGAIIVTAIVSGVLENRALRVVAEDLLATGAAPMVFPDDVALEMSWPLIAVGVGLLILALVLRAARRHSDELSEIV
ncbi:hypothetical protein ACTVBU_05530 [Sanguibacter sp. A246]